MEITINKNKVSVNGGEPFILTRDFYYRLSKKSQDKILASPRVHLTILLALYKHMPNVSWDLEFNHWRTFNWWLKRREKGKMPDLSRLSFPIPQFVLDELQSKVDAEITKHNERLLLRFRKFLKSPTVTNFHSYELIKVPLGNNHLHVFDVLASIPFGTIDDLQRSIDYLKSIKHLLKGNHDLRIEWIYEWHSSQLTITTKGHVCIGSGYLDPDAYIKEATEQIEALKLPEEDRFKAGLDKIGEFQKLLQEIKST